MAVLPITSGAVRIRTAELDARIYELRLAGWTLAAIGAEVGRTPANVRRSIQRSIHRIIDEPSAAIRAYELDRLDRLLAAVWDRAIGGDDAAIATALRILERRARYLGLDAQPAQTVEQHQTLIQVAVQLAPSDPLLAGPTIDAGESE